MTEYISIGSRVISYLHSLLLPCISDSDTEHSSMYKAKKKCLVELIFLEMTCSDPTGSVSQFLLCFSRAHDTSLFLTPISRTSYQFPTSPPPSSTSRRYLLRSFAEQVRPIHPITIHSKYIIHHVIRTTISNLLLQPLDVRHLRAILLPGKKEVIHVQ